MPLVRSDITLTEFFSQYRISETPSIFCAGPAMALSRAQIWLQCQRLLFPRTTVCAWVSTHFGYCSSSTWTSKRATKLLGRSPIPRGSLTTAQGKEKWMQGPICVSNLTAKHLSEKVKDSEELYSSNVAAYSSHLSPVRDTHPPDQSTFSLGVSCLLLNHQNMFFKLYFRLQ